LKGCTAFNGGDYAISLADNLVDLLQQPTVAVGNREIWGVVKAFTLIGCVNERARHFTRTKTRVVETLVGQKGRFLLIVCTGQIVTHSH
jgi:hypothetical protein